MSGYGSERYGIDRYGTGGSTSGGGAAFTLQSASVRSSGLVIRARFSAVPKQSSAAGLNDALNINNYSLSGPGFVSIALASSVSGDSQSIDLTLSTRLAPGVWLLTASDNIQTVPGVNLTAPRVASLIVGDYLNTNINPGSINDTCQDILRRHLNPVLTGPNWDALVAAIAVGDCHNFENNQLGFDQGFIVSASGKYLDLLAFNEGIFRPENTGINDNNFREYLLRVTNNKLVNEAVLEVLEVFYGKDAVRAHAISEASEPYVLEDGNELNIVVDGVQNVKVTFNTSEFTQISVASAAEVAAAITRAFLIQNLKAFAISFLDTQNGTTKIKIYTQSLGLKGSVKISGYDGIEGGGKSQNSLKFETYLNPYTGPV